MVASSKGLHRVNMVQAAVSSDYKLLVKQPKYLQVIFIFHFIHPKRKHHGLEEICDTFEVLEDAIQIVDLKL